MNTRHEARFWAISTPRFQDHIEWGLDGFADDAETALGYR
jgi:hypothetical protein